MSKIHLEERQEGAFDHRTFITIVQRSEAKLGQASSLAYVLSWDESGATSGQACIPRVLIIVRWARWGKW
jgi:hypothetical protein